MLNRCRKMLYESDLTCVVADDEGIIYTSRARGILPMLEILSLYEEAGKRPKYQADRIMGKAAMIISAHCGIKEIYSDVVSRAAYDIAQDKGIDITFAELVDTIMDPKRDKEGPFETALKDTDPDDFEKAMTVIRQTLEKVMMKR